MRKRCQKLVLQAAGSLGFEACRLSAVEQVRPFLFRLLAGGNVCQNVKRERKAPDVSL
jgi:hypothetical protein